MSELLPDGLNLFESIHKETFEAVLVIAIGGFFGGFIAGEASFVVGGLVALGGFVSGLHHLPGVERVTREFLEVYGEPDADDEVGEPDVVVAPKDVVAIEGEDEIRYVRAEDMAGRSA